MMLTEENCPYLDKKCGTHAQCVKCIQTQEDEYFLQLYQNCKEDENNNVQMQRLSQ